MLGLMVKVLLGCWLMLCDMAPYLLFGFLVAGVLSVLVSQEWVERHLGGRGLWPVLKAALFGVPLPLCSCGVIPVSASLKRHGASNGAVVSFLLSTPQTGVDSILVTWSLLGPVFAILRPLAAFVTGVIGGGLVDYGDRRAASDVAVSPVKCTDECCAPTRSRPRWLQALRYGFLVLPADLTKPMLAGIFIAGVIGAFVPPDFFAGTALGRGWSGMLVMMAVGIPIYVCATASVPIAASLIATGISPGAALVFLMTGPATNGATIATLWKMLGRKTALIYLAVIGCAALAFGALLDLFIRAHPAGGHAHGHSMIPPAVQCGSAILLLAILLAPLIPRLRRAAAVELPAAESVATQLTVTGMTCSHCAETVARALRECPGVTAVTVDLASGRAVVQGRASDVAALIAAVESVGYKAQSRS